MVSLALTGMPLAAAGPSGRITASQDNTGIAVVFGRIDDLKRNSGSFLSAERHLFEIIVSLVGPAAFAVSGDFVGKSTVDVAFQIDKMNSLMCDRIV